LKIDILKAVADIQDSQSQSSTNPEKQLNNPI